MVIFICVRWCDKVLRLRDFLLFPFFVKAVGIDVFRSRYGDVQFLKFCLLLIYNRFVS